MDDAYNVPDSTDWLSTSLKSLAPLENALHCQICKEFYDTPMITSCNHTFCSRCIRTSLSADGKCPACRASDQASKLRNNWAIQEVVSTFLEARPTVLEVARKSNEEVEATMKRRKRKRAAVLDDEEVEAVAESGGRTTRAKSRRIAASQTSQQDPVEIEDSDDEGAEELGPDSPAKDGLVECPLGCGKRMKEADVFNHLDKCEDEKKQASRASSRTPRNGLVSSRPPADQGARPQDRINELNYGMLKENALSKKLKEQGLLGTGSKQLMINRHREWVNIWNANCDSNSPRSRRELLRELDVWEKTQGGKAPQGNGLSHAVMRKDFDGNAYSKRHQDDFSRLIADAKRKKHNPNSTSQHSGAAKDVGENSAEVEAATHGDGKSSPLITPDSLPLTADEQDMQTSPTDPDKENLVDRRPYETDPTALSNLQKKVQAINDGQDPTPVLNEGFQNPGTGILVAPGHPKELLSCGNPETPTMFNDPIEQVSEETDPSRLSHVPTAPAEPVSLDTTEHAVRFGRADSRDEHLSSHVGSPCQLSSHVLLSSQPKRMPMFAMPEQPVTDVDLDAK